MITRCTVFNSMNWTRLWYWIIINVFILTILAGHTKKFYRPASVRSEDIGPVFVASYKRRYRLPGSRLAESDEVVRRGVVTTRVSRGEQSDSARARSLMRPTTLSW